MEIEIVEERTPQPFLDRALSRIRNVWRELAFSRSAASQQIRPDLPPADLQRVKGLMLGCLEEQGVATAARAQAAKLGYIYLTLDGTGRKKFLALLCKEFGLDSQGLMSSTQAFLERRDGDSYVELQDAVRPPRVQLLKMLNSLPDGFKFLVDLRADLLSFAKQDPSLAVLDHDLKALFEAWFDVGLLTFEDIDWDSSASLLEKLVAYEAVHEIRSWDDLKNRLDDDRRCYAFFHPKIPSEPLIFVEVALTRGMPSSIQGLLDVSAPLVDSSKANTAVFYSISNTQKGLRGISFGSFLLKQVMDKLAQQFPKLQTFVTLSPIPGFRRWVMQLLEEGALEELLGPERWSGLLLAAEAAGADGGPAELLESPGWHESPAAQALREPLLHLCARYLLRERKESGKPLDPVERFHIFNGARVERLNWMADTSAKGLRESFGLMVNYLYEVGKIEDNYELFFKGEVAASTGMWKLDKLSRKDAAGK